MSAISAVVGQAASAPAMTIAAGGLALRAVLNASQHAAVRPGLGVTCFAEALGIEFQATVDSIGDLQNDEQNPANNGYPMVVVPKGPIDPRLDGQNVRLTIAAASSGGEVLVVPVAALFASADGSVGVIRLRTDGTQERVPVTPGMTGDGFVAVSGALTPGDRVVVGSRQP